MLVRLEPRRAAAGVTGGEVLGGVLGPKLEVGGVRVVWVVGVLEREAGGGAWVGALLRSWAWNWRSTKRP